MSARGTMRPVRVTGLGVVSPHGDDVSAMFDRLLAGESAVRPVFPELPRAAAAATAAFDASRWFTKLQLAGVDRVSQLAVAAAGDALRDAGLGPEGHALDPLRIGVWAGCGMGGAGSLDAAYRSNGRIPPLTIPAFMPNAPASHVAMRHGVQGPVLTYSIACASAAVAIAEGAKAIAAGEVDVALVGGSEALLVPGVVMAWQAMQTLATFEPGREGRACRPFAADRSGFVLGEGAAFLVLESEAHAASRGARGYALLAGHGQSCDATHLTRPDAGGQARALRQALDRAGVSPSDVGYYNAHGTATKVGDVIECEAIRTAFGAAAAGVAVSSTKALHGHLLGAAGALEAVVTVLAVHRRTLPPNAGIDADHPADAACDVDLVVGGAREVPGLAAAVSTSFAFGGSNAALLFTRG